MHSPPSLPSTLLAAPAHPSQVIAIWNSYVWNNNPAVLLNHINNIYVHIGSTPFLTVKVFTKFYTPATSLLIFSLRQYVLSWGSSSARTLTLFLLSLSLCHEYCVVYPVLSVWDYTMWISVVLSLSVVFWVGNCQFPPVIVFT